VFGWLTRPPPLEHKGLGQDSFRHFVAPVVERSGTVAFAAWEARGTVVVGRALTPLTPPYPV